MRGSVFRRLYLTYTVIIILVVSILAVFLAGQVAQLVRDQTLDYNRQQLSSLKTAFLQQVSTLSYIKDKIYQVRIGPETGLIDAIDTILRDNRPFISVDEYDTFIDSADWVHTFFDFVQSSQQVDMALFQINGTGGTRGSMNILWPLQSMSIMPYADEINEIIASKPEGPDMFAYRSPRGAGQERYLYVLYDILYNENDPSQIIGYLINGYEASTLSTVLGSFSYPLAGTAYVLTDSGEVLYDSAFAAAGTVPGFFDGLREGLNEQDGFYYNVIHDPAGFYVVGQLDAKEVGRGAAEAVRSIVIAAVVCAVIAVALMVLATSGLSRRVRRVTGAMAATEGGDLTVRARITGSGDEMDQIAQSFNHMVGKLDEHIQAEYVSELARQRARLDQREAELFALQAQVNPHFLYNTLEIIRMQAVTNGDEDTALLIRWLAQLFRRRIHSSAVITLREELSFCEGLVDILQAKFGGEVTVTIDVPDDLMSCGILKDLVQPPLENAFVHGFTVGQTDPTLEISATQSGSDILIRIANNGTAITPDMLESIHAQLGRDLSREAQEGQKHIGLVNVDQRIRLAYGPEYGLQVQSGQDGTLVTLRIAVLSPQDLTERISQRR